MAWAVGNARVEPWGNAITITKQASGTAKTDPLIQPSLPLLGSPQTRQLISPTFGLREPPLAWAINALVGEERALGGSNCLQLTKSMAGSRLSSQSTLWPACN
jgi:hypothetical protein